MSLYKYAQQCFALSNDVKTHLTGDEYEDVFDLIHNFSVLEWTQWCDERADALRRFAAEAPARQQKRLQKMPRDERLLTVFALSQFYAEAAEFLEAASMLHSDVPYRDAAVQAWNARLKLENDNRSAWTWGGIPTFRDLARKVTEE